MNQLSRYWNYLDLNTQILDIGSDDSGVAFDGSDSNPDNPDIDTDYVI